MYRIIGADQREYIPISPEQLRQWVAEGRVNAQTKVLVEGATDWKPLAAFPEFSLLLGLQPPAASPATIQPLPFPPQRTNPFAFAGFIVGLLALVLCCCCYGLPFNVLGIIFSLVGMSQIKSQPEVYTGQGLAVAGLIMSLASIALAALMVILSLVFGWSDMVRELNL